MDGGSAALILDESQSLAVSISPEAAAMDAAARIAMAKSYQSMVKDDHQDWRGLETQCPQRWGFQRG